MRIKANRIALVASIGIALTGCQAIDDIVSAEQVDYKSTVRGQPLTLPPDLSQAQINPQYSTHDGVASAAAYNQAMAKANKANQGTAVLPEQAGMKILRSGDVRWLQLDRDAALVYPDLIAFWTNEGFTINRDNPAAGVIETDWAENRSKIPGNFRRRALGSIIDVVSDSGERERFTTRLERVSGKTEVFISHERMVETQMDRDGTTFKWLPANEDQGLNAAMLSRLMIFLGAEQAKAEQQVRNPEVVRQVSHNANFIDGENALGFNVAHDDAYRRVGAALASSGFSIDQSDAAAGTFVVRYLDTDTGEKRQGPNIFSRLFGDKGNLTPVPYTIRVSQGGGQQSIISVQDAQGNIDRSDTARRILTVLQDRL